MFVNIPCLFCLHDTNLFINGDDLLGIAQVLNIELENISHWLKVNKLSLNVKKTHYMILTSYRTSQPNHVIKIEGHKIDEVQITKFLGVYLDNKIKWKRHIDYIAGKVSRAIGMMTKARKFLTYESLKTLNYSFVYPSLIYCNHVWGNACSTSLQNLFYYRRKSSELSMVLTQEHLGILCLKSQVFLDLRTSINIWSPVSCIDGTWMIFLIYFMIIFHQFLL